jgi:hypothetical protein
MAASAGSVLLANGLSTPRIIGIPLNGVGTELILDTDHGVLDGDRVYDRAVGPMQFIPSTWAQYATDGNGDGTADPFNIYDAAASAAKYLCDAGAVLRTRTGKGTGGPDLQPLQQLPRECARLGGDLRGNRDDRAAIPGGADSQRTAAARESWSPARHPSEGHSVRHAQTGATTDWHAECNGESNGGSNADTISEPVVPA